MTHVDIARNLIDNGFSTFLVGGGVRDSLLGKIPKDYDLCTSATPENILKLFPGSKLVGAKFGVVLVGDWVEVATFREDGDYSDGRRPDDVRFSLDAAIDVRRRDFTINALLRDPITGAVTDYVGGLTDLLVHQVVRCVGLPDDRFRQDHLRMLRAVRFAANLGFGIECETFDSIQRNAHLITKIAPERIRDEFDKMLLGKNPEVAFRLLLDSGLMLYLCPEFLAMRGCLQPEQFHPEGDVFKHTSLMLANMRECETFVLGRPDWVVTVPFVLAVLFHDVGKPATQTVDDTGRIRFSGHEIVSEKILRAFLDRFKYPNDVSDEALFLVREHMRVGRLAEMKLAKQKLLALDPRFATLCELLWLDCLCSDGDMSSFHFAIDLSIDTESDRTAPRLVTGLDLINLGMKPGPAFKEILQTMYELQLDGTVSSKEEAIAFVLRPSTGF